MTAGSNRLPAVLRCTCLIIMVKLGRVYTKEWCEFKMITPLERYRMKKADSIADKLIVGSLVALLLAEMAHLAALFLGMSFSMCAVMMAVLFMLGLLCVGIYGIWRSKVRTKQTEGAGLRQGVSLYRVLRLYPVCTLLFAGMVLFQIVWNFWMHTPYIAQDITGETVQTMLATDTIYQVNPLTGQAYNAGMPMRLKVLVLPTLYGAFCKWTGLSVSTVCFQIMPMIILLLSYLVYGRLAAYFFPEEGKKQVWFMLFVALIYQFGCYSPVMDGYLLFFGGGQGAAFRACVLLPYALLCSLKGEWKKVALCLLSEVFVVWTFYGLGYVALTVFVIVVLGYMKKLADRRKKA